MRKVALGQFAIVDDDDFGLLDRYTWCVGSHGYAVTTIDGEAVLMHRLTIGARDGEYVDHLNGNKLDNRRTNLRVCTQSSNLLNCGSQASRAGLPSSDYKGVHYLRRQQLWGVQFRGQSQGIYLYEIDAAIAYDNAVRRYGDKHARLNFPDGVIPPNTLNRKAPRRARANTKKTSRFKGVSWSGQQEKWAMGFYEHGKKVAFFFDDEVVAARSYDAICHQIHGEWALLNFPDDEPAPLAPKHQSIVERKFL